MTSTTYPQTTWTSRRQQTQSMRTPTVATSRTTWLPNIPPGTTPTSTRASYTTQRYNIDSVMGLHKTSVNQMESATYASGGMGQELGRPRCSCIPRRCPTPLPLLIRTSMSAPPSCATGTMPAPRSCSNKETQTEDACFNLSNRVIGGHYP